MTYMEYFKEHDTENIGWCKPYADKAEENWLIMYEGIAETIITPMQTLYRYIGTLTEQAMAEFAITVNNGYHCYHGWTDEEIALDTMHEMGCAYCPLREQCEAMYEEIETGEEN